VGAVARPVRVQRLVRRVDHGDDDGDDVDADDACRHGRNDDPRAHDASACDDDSDRSAAGDHDGSGDDADDASADGNGAAAVAVSDLLTFEEAQAQVLARVRALAGETVAIGDAAGRVTAEDAGAVVDLPPFPSSAMDGFAVRAADLPGTLPVVEEIAAGRPATRPLAVGEAMGISTGGVVPDGADAVVPVEYVVQHDNSIDVAESVAAGAHVRPRGGDVAAGVVVVEAGVRLGAAQIGALAAAGIAEIRCARLPRVAVLSTGTELARPGVPLAPGQVYEANAVMLAAALAAAGATTEVLPAVADDESALRAALERGLAADVFVTSGGVSVGPHDLVRRIEAELGVEERFWRVAIKPGKPVSFGVRGETLVFGLPGNPVSSLVGCELFVKPAVRALQGLAEPLPRFEPGRLAAPLRQNDARDELVRARSRVDRDETGLEVTRLDPVSGQESHMIVRAAGADALVHVPRGIGELPAGAPVRWLRLGSA
jgi:molybdopterin molybdotransferase